MDTQSWNINLPLNHFQHKKKKKKNSLMHWLIEYIFVRFKMPDQGVKIFFIVLSRLPCWNSSSCG